MYSHKITIDNFRDLGGLQCPDGIIKEGKIFRSASLKAKTSADKFFIEGLHLDAIVDFRTEVEVAEGEDYVPEGTEYIRAGVFDSGNHVGVFLSSAEKRAMLKYDEEQSENLKKIVAETYIDMPFAKAYNKIFSLMDDGKSFAFHCTAGKDRTGVCAFMIESAFGRSLEDCEKEYLLSNDYRADTNNKLFFLMKLLGVTKPAFDAIRYAITVEKRNFDIMLNAIFEKYNSIAEYLEKEFDITAERKELWKSYYLEKQ